MTFTPVGDNGSVYSLQDQTLVSSDESFTPAPVEPSATATNEFTSQTETSVRGVVHVNSNTGAGDLHYSIESSEVPASAGISPPTVSEATLPNGEIQEQLEATLPPPAEGPPLSSSSSLLFPGEFETCTIGGGCEVAAGRLASLGSFSRQGTGAGVNATVRPALSGGAVLTKVKAIISSVKSVKSKIEALKTPTTRSTPPNTPTTSTKN